jgi:hypothetical protein
MYRHFQPCFRPPTLQPGFEPVFTTGNPPFPVGFSAAFQASHAPMWGSGTAEGRAMDFLDSLWPGVCAHEAFQVRQDGENHASLPSLNSMVVPGRGEARVMDGASVWRAHEVFLVAAG